MWAGEAGSFAWERVHVPVAIDGPELYTVYPPLLFLFGYAILYFAIKSSKIKA